MKYVLIYEDCSGCVNHRFFETDSEIPFDTGIVHFFDADNNPREDLSQEQNQFIKNLEIYLEDDESILILEIPESMPYKL